MNAKTIIDKLTESPEYSIDTTQSKPVDKKALKIVNGKFEIDQDGLYFSLVFIDDALGIESIQSRSMFFTHELLFDWFWPNRRKLTKLTKEGLTIDEFKAKWLMMVSRSRCPGLRDFVENYAVKAIDSMVKTIELNHRPLVKIRPYTGDSDSPPTPDEEAGSSNVKLAQFIRTIRVNCDINKLIQQFRYTFAVESNMVSVVAFLANEKQANDELFLVIGQDEDEDEVVSVYVLLNKEEEAEFRKQAKQLVRDNVLKKLSQR